MGGSNTISSSETKAEALRLQSSSYGAPIPVVHGQTRVAGNLLDYGDFQAIARTETQEAGGKGGGTTFENTTYTYTATILIGLCEGPITLIKHIWAGKIKYPEGVGPPATSITYIKGLMGSLQPSWSPLAELGGDHVLNYSGLAVLGVQDYGLGNSVNVPNHNFEVVARGAYQAHSTLPDADAAFIVTDWVTSKRLGRGLPASILGDLTDLRDWSRASGLMFSPALTEQASAADRIKQLCDLVHAAVVPADGKLHFVPLATEPVSRTLTAAGGATTTFSFTPDLTPLFELNADHLLANADEPRIKVTRKTPADVYNIVKVEFRNRANEYALDVAVAEDRANVDVYGAKAAETIKADWIHDHQVAQTFARMKLQRHLTHLRTYEFRLPWNFAEILPSNLLLINDPDQGLANVLVRVESMDEEADGWAVKAVDCPAVQSAAPVYALPVSGGFTHAYTALPGDTMVKALFEAPYELADTGLEVWAAVGGGPNWGGAHIWVSVDNLSYKRVGSTFGASRVGSLTGAISGGALSIDEVTGKVLSGSAQDAAAKATLCYIGGANPEYLSYATATLTGPGAYTLSGLVRGQYGTTDAAAHAADDVWVRCDEALASSGPLDPLLIGKTVWVKFQSFNVFGLEVQDLADVDAVSYTLTGRYARPVPDPLNLLSQGSFELLAIGQTPEYWNGGIVEQVSGQAFSRCLKWSTPAVVETQSKIPSKGGDVFWVGGWGRADPAAGVPLVMGLRFFSRSGVSLGFQPAAVFESAAGWSYRSGVAAAPAESDYCMPEASIQGAPAVASYENRLAELVVRKQASTVDIQAGAATGAYSSFVLGPVSVTSPAFGTGNPDRQTITSLTVSTPVDCLAIITVVVDMTMQNSASGFSATFGGGLNVGVYCTGFINQGVSNRQGIAVIGASATKSGTATIADVIGLKAGTWTLNLNASKTSSDIPTASLSQVRFRVEVIKL